MLGTSIGIIIAIGLISAQQWLEERAERRRAEAKNQAHKEWWAKYGERAGCYYNGQMNGFVDRQTGHFTPMENHVTEVDRKSA